MARARRGDGPSLLEIHTDRYSGHFQGDPELYRDPKEVRAAQARMTRSSGCASSCSRRSGWLTPEQDAEMRAAAQKAVNDAIAFARESPYPAPEEALEDVFVAAM